MFEKMSEVIEFMKSNSIVAISLDGGKVNVSYLEKVFHKELPETAEKIIADIKESEEFSSKDYVTVAEAAELSGCCEATIINNIKKGIIVAERKGKRFFIGNDAITKFMESQVVPAGWKTIEEISEKYQYSVSYLSLLMKQYEIKSVRIGLKKYFDYETFLKCRTNYETDVLINDGHRKGPVKFMGECKTK